MQNSHMPNPSSNPSTPKATIKPKIDDISSIVKLSNINDIDNYNISLIKALISLTNYLFNLKGSTSLPL